MNMSRMLSVASLVFAVVYYLVAVSGLMWNATPLLDVGIVATCGIFALFGILGLALTKSTA